LSELEIEANDLTIDVLRQRGAPRRNARNTRTIEVNIEPNLRLLKSLGISRKEFEEALPSALDKYENVYEVQVQLKGMRLFLEDIADIIFSGELNLLNLLA